MFTIDSDLGSVARELMALRLEHADLDALIDAAAQTTPVDALDLRRLKKKRLVLRDKIARMESALIPDSHA